MLTLEIYKIIIYLETISFIKKNKGVDDVIAQKAYDMASEFFKPKLI